MMIEHIIPGNILSNEKKPYTAKLYFSQNKTTLSITKKHGHLVVTSFIDPKTGFLTLENQTTNAHSEFLKRVREDVLNAMQKEIERIDEMPEEIRKAYKSTAQLTEEMVNFVSSSLLDIEVQQALKGVRPYDIPVHNRYVIYQDQPLDEDNLVTRRMDYPTPNPRTLNDDYRIIDDFLDVFFDKEDKKTFAWYFGAVLSNEPVYAENISRLLTIVSTTGGNGKSTLLGTLADALLTREFYDSVPDFDSFFLSGNKFATSNLSYKRLTIHQEAKWNGEQNKYKKDEETHDFAGLDDSSIKTLLTEGYIGQEEKGEKRMVNRLDGLHIVLSNHIPVVTKTNRALSRRILAVKIKPTSMTRKARILKLFGLTRFRSFVYEHRQKFAEYFVSTYQQYKYDYINEEYDTAEYRELIEDSMRVKSNLDNLSDQMLRAKKYTDVLVYLMNEARISLQEQEVIMNEIREAETDENDNIIHDEDALYINSTKAYLSELTTNATALRNGLKRIYGDPIRLKGVRMFKLTQPVYEIKQDLEYLRLPDELLPVVQRILLGEKDTHIRYVDDCLLIDSSMEYWDALLGKESKDQRAEMRRIYGNPVKRFSSRWYKVPLVDRI